MASRKQMTRKEIIAPVIHLFRPGLTFSVHIQI